MKLTPKTVAITGAIAFTVVAVFVMLGATDPMNTFVYELVQPLSGQLFAYITELGSAQAIVVLTIIGLSYWVWRGERTEAWRLVAVGLVTLLLTQGFKLLFAIDRPLIDASLDATTYSFPSGHASGSVAFYGLMAYLFYRRGQSFVWVALLAIVAFFVSMSRVILNVHYFSDVLGGWLVALTVIAASEWYVRRKAS